MSSNQSSNSNSSLPSNVQIKVEPGTSMPVPLTNIKTEPGLSTTTTRLTSFRVPRDLTLGANIKTEKPKKIYTPNLNAQRTKKKDDAGQSATPKAVKSNANTRTRPNRGRGRGSSNLIQSSGVWSTGITSTPAKRYSNNYGDSERSPQTSLEKPKLDLTCKVDKTDEEEKVKLLLRDDFIDDGEPLDLENGPTILPLVKEAKLYKEEVKIKLEKKEEEDEEEEEEIDRKPILLENGEVLPPKKESKIKISKYNTEVKDEFSESIPQIIENKTNSYILIQFPDSLPGFVGSAEEPRPNRSNAMNFEKENEKKCQTEFCTLNNLNPGILGKLQILKSGKARLLLGENNLIVDVGSHISFRQDLIAAKVDSEKLNGDLINLGPASNTLICSPDWETMLAKL